MRYENKKLAGGLEKERNKVGKLEKEIGGFKSWLGEVTGVVKVV